MVVTPFGLEPEAECRPAVLAVVGPGATPADPRIGAVPVRLAAPGRQVGVGAAGELRVVPVPAPLEGVAVHVVDSPGVRRVAADPGRLPRRRPGLAPVVGLAPEVRLPAAERVAERRGGVVPARQAYSHWASVGRRNSQPSGSSPDRRAESVRSRQNASAPAKLTLPTGNSSPSGSSAVGSPGSVPTTRFQSPCVTSYFPAQKPRVSVTSTRVSSGRRSGSPGGGQIGRAHV